MADLLKALEGESWFLEGKRLRMKRAPKCTEITHGVYEVELAFEMVPEADANAAQETPVVTMTAFTKEEAAAIREQWLANWKGAT